MDTLERKFQIKADGEMRRIVMNEQCTTLVRRKVNRLREYLHTLRQQCIGFAMKFNARHAVADIPQAGGGIAKQALACALEIGQPHDTWRTHDGHVACLTIELFKAIALVIDASAGDAIKVASANRS